MDKTPSSFENCLILFSSALEFRRNKIDFITVGPIFQKLKKDRAYETVVELSSELTNIDSSAILLKGSRGIELEKLITHL